MFVVPLTAGAGSYLTLRVRSPIFGLDLSTATDLSTAVLRRDGSATNFVWSILSSTARELFATYSFVGGEFTTTGAYGLGPLLTAGGVVVPCESVAMMVTTPFDCRPQHESETWLAVASQVSPTSAAVRQTWAIQNSDATLSPFAPWNKVDSTNGDVGLTLWTPNRGDIVVLSDYKHKAALHNVTLFGSGGGDQVPQGDGTFGASVVFSNAGFINKLKFDDNEGLWIPW
jgi:hypothetical protein